MNREIIYNKELYDALFSCRNEIKSSDVIKDLFLKYKTNLDEIDLIPMCFSKLDVSAQTNHGIIYFNIDLANKNDYPDNIKHYMVHEITHELQQTHKPTQSSDDGNYLDNKAEQEGFQNQTAYMADQHGSGSAESYIEQVLDHHDITNESEREKRKKKLLELVDAK